MDPQAFPTFPLVGVVHMRIRGTGNGSAYKVMAGMPLFNYWVSCFKATDTTDIDVDCWVEKRPVPPGADLAKLMKEGLK